MMMMMMMMNVEEIAIKQQKMFPVTISQDTPASLRFDRCCPLNSTTKEYLEVKKNCFNTFTKLLQIYQPQKRLKKRIGKPNVRTAEMKWFSRLLKERSLLEVSVNLQQKPLKFARLIVLQVTQLRL